MLKRFFLIRCSSAQAILIVMQKLTGLTHFPFVTFVGPERTTGEESSSMGSEVETLMLRRILIRPRRLKLPRETNLATGSTSTRK